MDLGKSEHIQKTQLVPFALHAHILTILQICF